MMKFATTLLASALLLTPAGAQNPPPDASLPSAPSAAQPRFPSTTAQPVRGSDSKIQLSTLPPAAPQPIPAQSAAQQTPAANPNPAAAADAATSASATPSSDAQVPEEADYRIGVEVDLVNLIFTATDKHGHFIKDLKQDDIRLLDQGKPPLKIQTFESETGLPLRVGLLIDASNSIRERFHFEQQAAIEFLHQIVRPKSDLAFVVGFDSTADLTQNYTDNTEMLAHGVSVLRPGGGTALHDAVYDACQKLAKAPARSSARRAIILLSDGDDNQSRHSREQAIEAALRAEVLIYVIDTADADSNRKGDKVLMRYAEATGGRVFFPQQLGDVTTAFKQIQDELRSQYVLAYKPDNFVQDGSYRTISIDVPKHSNMKIRVRKGYYAPKGS